MAVIIAKGVLFGALVIGLQLVLKDGSTKLAALAVMLPFSVLALLISTGFGQPQLFEDSIRAALLALPVWIAFMVALLAALQWSSLPVALLIGSGVWLVSALIYLQIG